jgi:hypothetical protein
MLLLDPRFNDDAGPKALFFRRLFRRRALAASVHHPTTAGQWCVSFIATDE